MERPGLALRLAFVGRRDLGGRNALIAQELDGLFRHVEARLGTVAQRGAGGAPAWYRPAKPRLTLVTGLADGADQLAGSVFLEGRGAEPAERVLGTVLPFGPDVYVAASPIADVAGFRRLLASSSYVVELPDGGVGPGVPDAETQVAAYRAQAEIMLRQADILVAVLDETAGKPGGSRETVARALGLGIPVVRFSLGVAGAAVLHRPADLDLDAAGPAMADPDWLRRLDELIDDLLSPPATGGDQHEQRRSGGLVAEFYEGPSYRPKPRQRLWGRFDRLFRRRPKPANEAIAGPMESYWRRATALSHHYATLYRGTFLVSYTLAMVAVLLAVTALTVLAATPAVVKSYAAPTTVTETALAEAGAAEAAPGDAGHPAADEEDEDGKPHRPYSVWWVLLGLGLIEFAIVSRIFLLTRAANRGQWSELAADYRHLAEGLRMMAYLPAAGSFRPPALQFGPYATKAGAQNVVDRMLQSITRQAEPATTLPMSGSGNLRRLDPAAALAAIRGKWIGGQIAYHAANAETMHRMSERLAAVARISAVIVVAIVPIDLILVFLHALKLTLPGFLDGATPYLLWATAMLPAIIAGVNGLRSQSESDRLADRSEHLRAVLEKLAARIDQRRAAATSSIGTKQSLEVVMFADEMARLMLDEVTDWSALYSKELAET
jgi:hypothetical protein